MEKSLILTTLLVGFIVLDTVYSFPIDISSVGEGESNPQWLTNYFLTGFGFFLLTIFIIFGCLCCRNGKGFKQNEVKVIQEFSNSSGNLAASRFDGFVNPTLNSEVTIFPPLGANCNDICRFEPLPDIKYQAQNLRPAAFSYTEQEISSQDWFLDPHSNFPRNQLKYVQEYGRGWFGRVVEGEAQNIIPNEKVTKVMVKILHEDATPTDHMYFLHEVKFYRDLKHSNILRLLGQCLEMEPFLIILECYPNGDLKTFLSQNLASAQALVEQGVTLKMCSNITSGLQFMHENKFIHTDLAARNCLVGPDLTIKIGDYGNSIEIFKTDYYCAGSVALPVRWCAPETLKCTDITIETREVTPPANIWSLGVVFWEICEFCKLPYAELNDDEVIVRVLGEKNYFLEKPNMFCLHKDELYHLMKLCWKPPVQRPSASQIYVILNNLISSGKINRSEIQTESNLSSEDFEQRWQNLKPNSIPKKDNAVEVDREPPVDCGIISLKLKNAKVGDISYVDSPLGVFMSNKSPGQESPRVCLKNDKKSVEEMKNTSVDEEILEGETEINVPETANQEKVFDPKIGKVEFDYSTSTEIFNSNHNLKETQPEVDSWLKGVEINNEEDESFVRKISEAIRDLDATLAMEKTSSSEENSGKSTRQNSPGKDAKETNEITVDFKLGQDTSSFMNFTQKTFELSSLQNSEQPQSLNFSDTYIDRSKELGQDFDTPSLIIPFLEGKKCKSEILDESLKENDSLLCGQSRNSSDTDDEIWRRRIERGEISEKVKEKSKSIANLMILTHIDSDDSDIDIDKSSDKGLQRSSFNRRSGSFAKTSLSSNNFGSENDLTFTVLEDDFKESLKKLSDHHREHGHFDSLGVILPLHANRENIWENMLKSSKSNEEDNKNSQPDTEEESGIEKELKQTSKDRGNFLDNAVSKNYDKNKIEEKENVSSQGKNLENFPEKKDISTGAHLECDNKTTDINSTALLQNSSRFVDSETSGRDKITESANKLPKENVSDCENFVEDFLDKDIFLGISKNNEEKCTVPSSVSKLNSNDQSQTEGNLNDTVNLISKFRTDETAPNNLIKEEKKSENKPSRSSLVPQITVTEEPEEFIESPEETFVMEMPPPKPLKFVIKDEKIPTEFEIKETTDFNNSKPTPFDSPILKNNIEKKKKLQEENPTVIVGACENFTMDFFKGLKTTSEDMCVNNKNLNEINEYFQNRDENIDVWDKHLENALTEQLNNTNFDDISFRNSSLDFVENQKSEESNLANNLSISDCSAETLTDFLESERLHTEKLEESIHINRLTNLSVMASEEEYEHFKLRTPDDERSSDSGFRDKGSLSESVEDACEGKYNLEDIEAELEEAFVKGVFANCETDKEKDASSKNSKNSNNFEYEESKFYEDENRNDEDFSDIDGEIEFWQNKDESDYYPEISEFNPTCSQGWYLHPPDENVSICNRNINEDIVNALRNELQESLPVQNRSFEEFNEFYERDIEDSTRDVNIHYMSDFSFPLSPILEEQDSSNSNTSKKSLANFLLEGNTNKVKKNMVKLIESAKAIDTNTFIQYLDYMVENEGKDLYETDETPEKNDEQIENGDIDSEGINSPGDNKIVDGDKKGEAVVLEDISKQDDSFEFPEYKSKDDILVVNINTNEATILEGKVKPDFSDGQRDYYLDTTDNSENDGLIFTPEMLSPDRERSFSEASRSSNGTRTGDALSEITLSSPDLVPDCFSTLNQDTNLQNESKDVTQKEVINTNEDNGITSPLSGSKNTDTKFLPAEVENQISSPGKIAKSDALESSFDNSEKSEELPKNKNNNIKDTFDSKDSYEMSTSFMGEDVDEDFSESEKFEQKETIEEKSYNKTPEDLVIEDGNAIGWQSESSEDEDLSSSSEEFIWKDGNKESKIKASHVGSFAIDNTLYENAQNDSGNSVTKESKSHEDNTKEEVIDREIQESEEDDDDDDNDSSTGSSASFTDFVPSAWNSQATPSRSVLKSPDNKKDKRKKNVWFKKQKYHCVYEYPREPSDSDEADGSPFKQSNSEKNFTETPIKHFNYGVNTVELPNQHFPYGISKVIDLSAYTDWDVAEGEDVELSLTDTDSDNGSSGKNDLDITKKTDCSFYNLSPFDYDFNTTDMPERESEFFVSSSSRPFQGGSSANVSPGLNADSKTIKNDIDSRDFVTPDSGVEDCPNTLSPLDKIGLNEEKVYLNILDNLNFSKSDGKENNEKEIDSFESVTKCKNGFPMSNGSVSLPNNGLGQLKHTRNKLKLDLPHNHNAKLGSMMEIRKD